jgi:hypothetical protein
MDCERWSHTDILLDRDSCSLPGWVYKADIEFNGGSDTPPHGFIRAAVDRDIDIDRVW